MLWKRISLLSAAYTSRTAPAHLKRNLHLSIIIFFSSKIGNRQDTACALVPCIAHIVRIWIRTQSFIRWTIAVSCAQIHAMFPPSALAWQPARRPCCWSPVQRASDTDIKIHSDWLDKTKRKLNQMFSNFTEQPLETIERGMERDHYLTAEDAQAYGIVDEVLLHRWAARKAVCSGAANRNVVAGVQSDKSKDM